MVSVIFHLLVSWYGLGPIVAGGCIAAWWFIPEVPWLTDKLRLLLLLVGLTVGGWSIGIAQGALKGVGLYQASLTKQINKSIQEGDKARTEALKKFDATKEIGDDGFARD